MANEGLDLFADAFVPGAPLAGIRPAVGRGLFAGQVIAFAADVAAHVVITVPEVLAGFGWIPDGSLLAATLGGRLLPRHPGRRAGLRRR